MDKHQVRQFCLEQAVRSALHGDDGDTIVSVAQKFYAFMESNSAVPSSGIGDDKIPF
jgi:hypothetical protein